MLVKVQKCLAGFFRFKKSRKYLILNAYENCCHYIKHVYYSGNTSSDRKLYLLLTSSGDSVEM